MVGTLRFAHPTAPPLMSNSTKTSRGAARVAPL